MHAVTLFFLIAAVKMYNNHSLLSVDVGDRAGPHGLHVPLPLPVAAVEEVVVELGARQHHVLVLLRLAAARHPVTTLV